MATRIEKIIKSARVTLADKNAERWSDDDLLDILNEGHKDFCRQTELLTGRAEINPTIGDPYFTLPDDCWLLTRALYDDRVLPLVSHTELDITSLAHYNIDFGNTSDAWENEEGTPAALIYDRRNLLECKLFPIPDDSVSDIGYEFTRPDDRPAEFAGDEAFGFVTGITPPEYTLYSDFGVLTELYDPSIKTELFSNDFGVVTDINEVAHVVKLYYIKNPTDLVDISSDLEIPAMFDTALKYYVVGHAFMNDLNEEYQAKGRQQLGFYEREVKLGNKTVSRDGTRAGQQHTTYRGAF